jgi:Domain of unknown function (DUF3850)
MQKLVHHLKTWPEYFGRVKNGDKPFEIRKNDRDYKVGDELLLQEFVPEGYYAEDAKQEPYFTGQVCHRKITYILNGGQFGIEKGYVALGLQVV